MVLVAIAMIMVLVAVLMSITLINFQMKRTDEKSRQNFYSAEEAIDQIHAGLEGTVSNATDAAYMLAMQQYKADYVTEAQRVMNFRNHFITNDAGTGVRDILVIEGETNRYEVGGPTVETLVEGSVYTKGLAQYLTKDYAKLLNDGKLVLTCKTPTTEDSLVTTTAGVKLLGLCVGYTNDEGYYTEINTDILISFPEISLKESTVLPNVFDYAFIADKALNVGVSGDVTQHPLLKASIYAGEGGINVPTGHILTVKDSEYLITKGTVNLNRSTMTVDNMEKGGSLWAAGINMTGATTMGESPTSCVMNLNSTSYIADDMTLNKYNVTANVSGKYYGYGSGENVQTSAIIVNSANTRLDMSGLSDLLLSGNAYINGNSVAGASYAEGETVPTVLMGTSVSMKTDQIVFLAPAEVLGTVNGEVYYGKNPMTEAEYQAWSAGVAANGTALENYKQLDPDALTSLLNTRLRSYGITQSSYKVIAHPFRGNAGAKMVYYVYLSFPNEEYAADYYRDYVAAAKTKIGSYINTYKNDIKYNKTNYITKGNILTYSLTSEDADTKLTILHDTLNSTNLSTSELKDIAAMQTQYEHTYSALCAKLTTNYTGLKSSELDIGDVYTNIINKSVVNSVNKTTPASYSLVIHEGETEHTVYAKVVNNATEHLNDEDADPTENAYEVGSESTNPDVKLVIASGNVTVKGSFSGLIIAGGSINLTDVESTKSEAARTITGDISVVTSLLQSYTPEGKTVIATYFNDGSDYSIAGGTGATESDKIDYVSLESSISYVNWTKN